MTIWPTVEEARARDPDGAVRRRIDVDARFVDGRMRFTCALADTWFPDPGTGQEPYPLHRYRMWVVAEGPELTVVDIGAEPQVLPFRECPDAASALDGLLGATLTGTFVRRARQVLQTVEGCTHLLTMARAIGAEEVIGRHLFKRPEVAGDAPVDPADYQRLVDVCRGWRSDGEAMVAIRQGHMRRTQWRAETFPGVHPDDHR